MSIELNRDFLCFAENILGIELKQYQKDFIEKFKTSKIKTIISIRGRNISDKNYYKFMSEWLDKKI